MKRFLVKWFWQDGHWQAVAWLCGIGAGVFWVYSGAPMICH
ncbi:hypothetical protein QTI17_33230 [Variovorax sp. J31P179]|nr:hypothetical protein [Variovorax sp. J31P179]MDM0085465.1 hypothetical protein [Variovorax sp. J31P179]